ncbi:MAG: hypothetical protein V2B18_04180 [Pseudomonadota bacterium]
MPSTMTMEARRWLQDQPDRIECPLGARITLRSCRRRQAYFVNILNGSTRGVCADYEAQAAVRACRLKECPRLDPDLVECEYVWRLGHPDAAHIPDMVDRA